MAATTPVGVVQVQQVEQLSMPHLLTIPLEPQLATSRRIDLEWRPVMNWYEHSEIKMYDYITVRARSDRQTLFEDIKYSDFGEHTFYQGGWGPEPMIWSTSQEQGFVHCTEARQEEIQQWVRDTVFNCAPGND
jgi:hypothetical protein